MSEARTRTKASYYNPAELAQNPDYAFLPSVTVPLVEPIKLGGTTVSELTLRRPKVKDNKAVAAFKGTDTDRGTYFLMLLTGLAPDEFDQLDGADLELLGEWLDVFRSARRTI